MLRTLTVKKNRLVSYLDLEWRRKQLAVSAKQLALSTALRSEYAKRTYDFIPTWIVSYILRTIVEFVLYYRLYSDNYFFNISMAVCVSVCVTICSPFFYDVVWQYKGHIQKFTDHVANHMTWEYFYIWQRRIVLGAALVTIAILTQIEITSWWLIECIIHTIVCGFILGKFEELRDYLAKPKVIFVKVVNMLDIWKADERRTRPVHKTYLVGQDVQCCILSDYSVPQRAERVRVTDGRAYRVKIKVKNTINSIVIGKNSSLIINNVYMNSDFRHDYQSSTSKIIPLQKPHYGHVVKKRSAFGVFKRQVKGLFELIQTH